MTRHEVVALGSAVVDLTVNVRAREVDRLGLSRGTMTLASVEEVDDLLRQLRREPTLSGGGSAANTAAGLGLLGVETTVVTRVGDDELAERWVDELVATGVDVVLLASPPKSHTARSVVLVDEFGERTMVTALGVAGTLDAEDVPAPLLAEARWCLVEGYVLDAASSGFESLLRAVRSKGSRIALSLGDQLLVERHRERIVHMLGREVDVVLGNGAEGAQLVRQPALSRIVSELQARRLEGALTLGRDGAVVFDEREAVHQPAPSLAAVVDTTGAGDQFAAGYLAAATRGGDLAQRALLGTFLGTAVVEQPGARLRPEVRRRLGDELPELVNALGLDQRCSAVADDGGSR